MHKFNVKNIWLIALSTLCLTSVAIFSAVIGVNFQTKNEVSLNIIPDSSSIYYGKNYELKKGSFEYYEEFDFEVDIFENSYQTINEIDSSSLKAGDTFNKNDVIAIKSGSNINASEDGVVVKCDDGDLEIYYFNSFEVKVLLSMFDYKNINFREELFYANINGSLYLLNFESVDLTSVGTEGVYKISFVTNDCKEIVRRSSFESVKKYVETYENVYFFDDEKMFLYDGEFAMLHYRVDDQWSEAVFMSIIKINSCWIVSTNIDIAVGTILYA